MNYIRPDLVIVAYNRSFALLDFNIQDTPEKKFEFMKQTILADKSLSSAEKLVAVRHINLTSDWHNVINNEGVKRICENCQEECLAVSYCENCIRNYLKQNFSNWTSENDNIDNLIQECQLETSDPEKIVEWIPYNNLENIKYLTKGGFSEIYIADWIDGSYIKWDNQEQQLIRNGTKKVILKKLENVENANRSWFDEGMSHLTISSKYNNIVKCHGLTRDPSDGNYMLVMKKMDIDLRKYLQQNYYEITWKKRIDIVFNVTEALSLIHDENAIHRDLHSGNILCYRHGQNFYISDLGFCGPQMCICTNFNSINSLIRNFSKVHIFKDLPEPRNATEEEQEAYHSSQLSLSIPNKIEDIVSEQSVNQSKQNYFTITDDEIKGKSKRIYSEDGNEDLTDNKSKKIKFNNNNVEFQYIQRNYIDNDDIEEDVISNNPNFHSEDQDELEIPEDGF
ncbi:kinase-like domain-containing protein [Rhizophagus clarus]|uniref:Kinase-like domain-containing protein n=1 Tax=Rhizophagus clarus TaxID=94130 RepID=A0A8H3M4S6_9GLOM|nr:kinase-like domain-containing protein [Rhizophagus clarus]